MIVMKWEPNVELERAWGTSPRPTPCRNDRHNLFWEYLYSAPAATMDTIAEHGVLDFRSCLRCSRNQLRHRVPETPDEADLLASQVRTSTEALEILGREVEEWMARGMHGPRPERPHMPTP